MDSRKLVWVGMIVGSLAGSLFPMFWGARALSFSSLIFSAIGGLAGIWIGFKLGQ